MEKREFIELFLQRLQEEAESCGAGLECFDMENGLPKAVAFRFEEVPNASIVYPDIFYHNYQEGTGIEPLVRQAVFELTRHGPIDFSGSKVDRELAEDRLGLDIVNYKENQERLKEIPHERFLDLALIVKWRFFENTWMELTGRMLSELQMTAEEVFQIARRNTFQTIKPLITLKDQDACLWEPEDYEELRYNPSQEKIYVLTTEGWTGGGSAIADTNTLKRIHEQLGEDFYVLPASRYQNLIVKKSDCENPDILMRYILDERRKVYNWEDALSKKTYLFDGRSLTFTRDRKMERDRETQKRRESIWTHRRSR